MRKIPFSCYLDQRLLRALETKSKETNFTIAALIREAILQYLKLEK